MSDTVRGLTSTAIRKVNWRRIDESKIGLRQRSANARAASSGEGIEAVFSTAQQTFNDAIADLESMTRSLTWVIGGTIALIIVVTLLGQFVSNALVGNFSAALSLGGVAALLATTFKLINAHRDIVILKLVPTKYAMGLQLARDDAQRADLFKLFTDDLSSLRTGEKLASGWGSPLKKS